MAGSSRFTERELEYLHGGRRLGRIATVGADGTPHVVPVGWTHNAEQDSIDVGGRDFERSSRSAWHAASAGEPQAASPSGLASTTA